MEQKTYGILDVAKFISALLVIAIHCAPLIEIDETLNFVYVQIIARLAVPFFFITSGWLFFRKIDPTLGWRAPENLNALTHYWKRIAKLYAIYSVLYVPLLAVSWIQGGFSFSTILRLIRDILFNGTYYHLWFFPALLLGVPLVYFMYTTWKKHVMLWTAAIFYMIGMLINVYGGVFDKVILIGPLIHAYESVFVTSRNGLFFAPIYLVLGIYAQSFITHTYKKQAGIAFVISFACYATEACLLRSMGILHDLTSMYLFLVPTVFFLFIFLMQFECKPKSIYPILRKMSLILYGCHIYFIFIFLNLLGWGNLLVYLLSIVCSCMLALWMIRMSKQYPILKAMM